MALLRVSWLVEIFISHTKTVIKKKKSKTKKVELVEGVLTILGYRCCSDGKT